MRQAPRVAAVVPAIWRTGEPTSTLQACGGTCRVCAPACISGSQQRFAARMVIAGLADTKADGIAVSSDPNFHLARLGADFVAELQPQIPDRIALTIV